MAIEHLKLTETERRYLTTLTSSGELKARQFKRAMTLLLLSEGKPMTAVSKTLKFSYPRVIALRDNYLEYSLKCLEEKPRSERPVVFDGTERAKITALACSDKLEGYANWSLRLLADRLVALELCPTISHTQVAKVLKKPTPAAFEENLVHWNNGFNFYRPNGTNSLALPLAIQQIVAGRLLRRKTVFSDWRRSSRVGNESRTSSPRALRL